MSTEPRIFWPMGCTSSKGDKLAKLWDSDDHIADSKINGIRSSLHLYSDGNRLFTRSAGEDDPDRPIEFTHRYPQLANMKINGVPDGTVLDGEVFSPTRRHEEVAGILNAKSEKPTAPDDFRFVAFDAPFIGHKDIKLEPWHKRRSLMEETTKELAVPHLVQNSVYVSKNKREFFDSILSAGDEGVVLKHIHGTYHEGKKPANNWTKAKKHDDFDCVITGFTEGKGKYAGQIGAIEYSQYVRTGGTDDEPTYTLKKIGQASGVTDAMRKEISANRDKYLNKVIVIGAQERIANKLSLQHPQVMEIRMSGDKSPVECIAHDVKYNG